MRTLSGIAPRLPQALPSAARYLALHARGPVRWVRKHDGALDKPTVDDVHHHIRTRRQKGEKLEDTIEYLKSIVQSGFRSNYDTLGSVIGTDVISPKRLMDIVPALGLQHTPIADRFREAWSRLFANYFTRSSEEDTDNRVIKVMQVWNDARKYRLRRELLVHILHHGGQPGMHAASKILSIRDTFSYKDTRSASSYQLLLYFVSFHMHVLYLEKNWLTNAVFDALSNRNFVFYDNKSVHRCLKAVWLADNHEDALKGIIAYTGGNLSPTFLETIWRVFCLAQYRDSYTPTVQHMSRFLRHVTKLGQSMDDFVFTTFLEGRNVATDCLQIAAQRRALGPEATAQHISDTSKVITEIQHLLGERMDCVRARNALVDVAARSADSDPKLLIKLPVLLREAWEYTGEPQESTLVNALHAAERAIPTAGLDIARAVFAVPEQLGKTDYTPTADVWAQWVSCLAAGNALREALSIVRTHIPDDPKYADTAMRVLECAHRVGVIRETTVFFGRHCRLLFSHPSVLALSHKLSKGRLPRIPDASLPQYASLQI